MTTQILDVVLYSHDGRVRRVPLKPGVVNIITGASKSGKSALIDIVDYCFGSGACRVPDGPIRSAVAWFGLRLQLKSGQAFIARKCPVAGKHAVEDCYLAVASQLDVPDASAVVKTTNTIGLIAKLTEWIGIDDTVHRPPAGQTRPPLSATVRHAIALCFQSQNELTRKEQLFHVYDPDTREQGFKFQALLDTLPYFVGAVDDDYIRKQQQLKGLRERLRSIERQLAEVAAIRGEGVSKAEALLAQARNIGLTNAVADTFEAVVAGLRELSAASLAVVELEVPDDREFVRLANERGRLLEQLRRIEDEITIVTEFRKDGNGFIGEAKEQEARLKSIEIFDGAAPTHVCPLCTQQLPQEKGSPTIAEVKELLSSVTSQLETVTKATPQVEKVLAELESRRVALQAQLARNRAEMEAVEESNARVSQAKEDMTRKAHVLGRVGLYLESMPELPDTVQLEKKKAELQSQIGLLEEELSNERTRERLESISSKLGKTLTEWAAHLELEHSQWPLRLDFKKLTIVADADDGPVPMDRMGSGENWVGYHLIGHLVLHQWFVKRNRPVPRFVFFDQPSQVYFPPEEYGDGKIDNVPDEDRKAVVRMFKFIIQAVKDVAPKLQVIVTEHADIAEKWFQDTVRQKWRGGEKLVPDDWPDA